MAKIIKNKERSDFLKKAISSGTLKNNLPKIPWNKGIIVDKIKYLNFGGRNKKRPDMIGNKFMVGKHHGKEFQKGQVPWNKGLKLPQISGSNHPMFGKTHSLKAKKKISLARLGKPSWNKGTHITNSGCITKESRKKLILPKKDTSIEIKIQNYLKELNINFVTHQYMNIEHGYQCDIFIPSKNLVIECFGDYWHNYPSGRELDKIRCIELRDKGYRVLVFWEREIKLMELGDLRKCI